MPKARTRIAARTTGDLEDAWDKYYTRLAAHFLAQAGGRRPQTVLEAGCGKGQLTLPLLRALPKGVKIIAVDSSQGPYLGWLNELSMKLRKEGIEDRVRLIRTDARRIRDVHDGSVDLVVSNELLCDLPYDSMLEKALGEFHRILRSKGIMVHGEWVSSPSVGPQSFLVKHWPSWTPDQLFSWMNRLGFGNIRVSYFDTTIHFGYENSVRELREWGAKSPFLARYDQLLRRAGLDLPFEHVIRCEKL